MHTATRTLIIYFVLECLDVMLVNECDNITVSVLKKQNIPEYSRIFFAGIIDNIGK